MVSDTMPEPSRIMTFRALSSSTRPRQWQKNVLVVAAPLAAVLLQSDV